MNYWHTPHMSNLLFTLRLICNTEKDVAGLHGQPADTLGRIYYILGRKTPFV